MSRIAPVNDAEREWTEGAAPYPAGWVDRITTRVVDLPVPGPVVYLLAWLVVIAIETLIKWWDGAYPVGTLYPFHAVFTSGLASITRFTSCAWSAIFIPHGLGLTSTISGPSTPFRA